jgi:hypothetical protein
VVFLKVWLDFSEKEGELKIKVVEMLTKLTSIQNYNDIENEMIQDISIKAFLGHKGNSLY